MIKAIFFDLDGTLLPMDLNEFISLYLGLLAKYVEPYGYDKKKIVDVLVKGTELMTANDGKKTNYDVFWEYFYSIFGEDKKKDLPVFESFYATEFKKTILSTKPNKYAAEIIDFCKKHFEKTILATNPFFPKVAVETRLSFINLNYDDFDFVTSYENSSCCKPNLMYFRWLLDKFNLKPEEVIMFGNDTNDDASISQLGIKCYIIDNTMINSTKNNYEYEIIKMEDVIPVLKSYL